LWSAALLALLMSTTLLAAQRAPPLPPEEPSPRAEAPIDLTGYWVSVITQDWLYRMVIPGRGNYNGIPFNLASKQFADSWSPAADIAAGQECKAYGVASVMRIPERLHITWQDDSTLRVETDAGMQTRLLRFKTLGGGRGGRPSIQGLSVATWEFSVGPNGGEAEPSTRGPDSRRATIPHFGALKVSTSHVSAGYLRKNGVPYSEQVTMLEYWETYDGPDGHQWLTIPTELDDPKYLQAPYDFAPIFRKEADGFSLGSDSVLVESLMQDASGVTMRNQV